MDAPHLVDQAVSARICPLLSFPRPLWVGLLTLGTAGPFGLASGLLGAGCTQSLVAIEGSTTNSSSGGSSSNCLGRTCDRGQSGAGQCCDGATCSSSGECVPKDAGALDSMDAGHRADPGQACTERAGCVNNYRCQTIGNDRICVYDKSSFRDGYACELHSDCGSLYCDANGVCANGTACRTSGTDCRTDHDCCSNICGNGNKCSAQKCSGFGETCESDADCCSTLSGTCVKFSDGTRRCLDQSCRGGGDVCSSSAQCCKGSCSGHQCQDNGSIPCLRSGLYCSGQSDCCTGVCQQFDYQFLCIRLDGCQPLGDGCSRDVDCCSGDCENSRCVKMGSQACLSEGELCGSADCCDSMTCLLNYRTFGVRRCSSVGSGKCIQRDYPCSFTAQCCNWNCQQKTSVGYVCSCLENGAGCYSQGDCCSGQCALGTCVSK